MSAVAFDERLRALGLALPDVRVPAAHLDRSAWPVLACDQHVHDDDYWVRARARVGDAPSTLSLVLPECDLERPGLDAAVRSIHERMDLYLADGTLVPAGRGAVVVRRVGTDGILRAGLMVAFDLELRHDPDACHLALRPTEAVVEERMPARLAIRAAASMELPHMLALADDAGGRLDAALSGAGGTSLYRLSLPDGGGEIEGILVEDPSRLDRIVSALEAVVRGRAPDAPFSWFVGDGNHSLEAACRHWDALRGSLPAASAASHPARFAMAELASLQAPRPRILPVHRMVRGASSAELAARFSESGARVLPCSREDLRARGEVGWIDGGEAWRVLPPDSNPIRTVAFLDAALDAACRRNPSIRIDYLHGWEEVPTGAPDGILVAAPTVGRGDLLAHLQGGGACPRKTFSLGTAADKRHYFEARPIRPADVGGWTR